MWVEWAYTGKRLNYKGETIYDYGRKLSAELLQRFIWRISAVEREAIEKLFKYLVLLLRRLFLKYILRTIILFARDYSAHPASGVFDVGFAAGD